MHWENIIFAQSVSSSKWRGKSDGNGTPVAVWIDVAAVVGWVRVVYLYCCDVVVGKVQFVVVAVWIDVDAVVGWVRVGVVYLFSCDLAVGKVQFVVVVYVAVVVDKANVLLLCT